MSEANEPTHDEAHERAQDRAPTRDLRTLPNFRPRRFAWELARDAAMRWAVVGAVVMLMVGLFVFEAGGSVVSLIAAVVVIGAWIAMSLVSAKVTRDLPALTAMVDSDPAVAEDALVALLERKPLLRWLRLLLYHRLAAVRHHQGRHVEAATICRAVLAHPLGPAEPARAHLLLLLTESSLAAGDVYGAYHALLGLHATPLSLIEALQRLALQLRYESLIGADDAVMQASEQKMALAELMPAPQCGAIHALLARSHDRLSHDIGGGYFSRYLWSRAELMCSPEQFAALRQGAWGVGIVGGTPQHMMAG